MRRKLKIKTGDIVKVIAGNQKGTQGKVLRVFANKNRAIVEGVNVVKKHNSLMQTIQKVELQKKSYLLIFLIFL